MKVFVSYKWEDEAHNKWVEKLVGDLRRQGIDALLDKWEIPLGGSFTDYMISKIAESDAFLFVITDKSVRAVEAPTNRGGAVKFELQLATARQIAGEEVRVIGIYRNGDRPPKSLLDRRYADFRDDGKYSESISELVDDLLGRSGRPPIGHPSNPKLSQAGGAAKKPSEQELKIASLREAYNRLAQQWYRYNYQHMDDNGIDYTSTINFLHSRMETIVREVNDLGEEWRPIELGHRQSQQANDAQ